MLPKFRSCFICLLTCAAAVSATTVRADLLVSSADTNQILRYDESTGAFLGVYAGGAIDRPNEAVFDAAGRLLVTAFSGDAVAVFNRQGTFVGNLDITGSLNGPQSLIFGPDGSLYISALSDDKVVRFSSHETPTTVDFIPAGSGGLDNPRGLDFGPDGNLYVSSRNTNQVLRYNGETGTFMDVFVPSAAKGGPGAPQELVFGPDGNLYVASRDADAVLRYNGTTGAFIDTFASGGGLGNLQHFVFGPDGHLYVGNQGADNILRYDGKTGAFMDVFVATGSGGLDDPRGLLFDFTINAGISGSWFDPNRSGEGWLIEILATETVKANGLKVPGLAVVYWFTYPQATKGAVPEQAWVVGVGSVEKGSIDLFDAQITGGAVFGPGFDPDDVVREEFAELRFRFNDCNSGLMDYTLFPDFIPKGNTSSAAGVLTLERITAIDGLDCENLSKTRSRTKVTELDASFSGSWYDPDHDGEGWLIEMLSGDVAVIYWFSYDSDGNQAWFVGVGTVDGKTITVNDVRIPRGGFFGDAFDSDDVSLDEWGTMSFTFDGCNSGTMSYVSNKGAEFGSGSLALARITELADLPCI